MIEKLWYSWIKIVFGIKILSKCPELFKYLFPEKMRKYL